MKLHTLTQGSQEWHAHRTIYNNASDTPVVMGHSPYKTRNAMIAEKATGIAAEIPEAQQRIMDKGHVFEAKARSRMAEIVGEELFQAVGTEGEWSASFDGITMLEDVIAEHKSMNAAIRAAFTIDELPIYYKEQMEHQLMVSSAERCLFMASAWDDEGNLLEEKHFWYDPDLELRKRIVAAWDLFRQDVANYKPAETVAAVVAEPVQDFPVLFVHAKGEVTDTNLPTFKAAVTGFLATLNKQPTTDQEFADAKAIAGKLREAATKLKERKADMLAQTASIGVIAGEMDHLAELLNKDALALEKAVKDEEDARKLRLINGGKVALNEHIASLNARLGKPYMPIIPADFAAAIKGKRNLANMQNGIDTELARAKIVASEHADRIEMNCKALVVDGADYTHLFPDLHQVCTKSSDDFALLRDSRIAAEAKRKADDAARMLQEADAKAAREFAAAQAAAKASTTVVPEDAPAVVTPEPTIAVPARGSMKVIDKAEITRRKIDAALDAMDCWQLTDVLAYIEAQQTRRKFNQEAA